ncbi:metal ABC transporter ATP-binding protein [candidate division WOR-3 bacterium]|nr:metal ABC transporter ATP-binding protein [candidate division WOR-3 bacterium]
MAEPIVELQHVYFSYDRVPVLEDVSITVHDRDFLSIIGPNGGGKTTILKILCGLLTPQQGMVRVFQTTPARARHRIGYLPQHLVFDHDFPIRIIDVVLMGRLGRTGLGHSYTSADHGIAERVLALVGLSDLKHRTIADLSGGQRQRVLIARALATEPQLLLLDEPVSSIDTQWQNTLYQLLNELNTRIAIVLVTHDISVVSTYIDKIACVNKKLFFHGSKKEGIQKLAELYECPVQILTHSPTTPAHDEHTHD